MKLTIVLLLISTFSVFAKGFSQITLELKNATLEQAFEQIEAQTGYSFLFQYKAIKEVKNITVSAKNISLETALELCFRNQPVNYKIVDKSIVIEKPAAGLSPRLDNPRPVLTTEPPPINITGRVVDENGQPVSGASVTIKGSKKGTSTNANGEFVLNDIDEKSVLIISGINIQDEEVKLSGQSFISITTRQAVKEEEQVVVAYNKISARSNTGAVTVVKGEQIQNIPNRSFDKSLQGLVPGLFVTNGNGQPGGAIGNFVLRGIATGGNPANGETFRNPLIVIDGIPVFQDPAISADRAANDGSIVSNPMAQLNTADIESISVLKDAAAIALYGSKASNGVILVTTKRGKAGKAVFNFSHQTDISSRLEGKLNVLNQQEYLELLIESYKNSTPGISDESILADLRQKFPVIVNAPGDTSFYPGEDWSKALYDNNAITSSNNISMSGGSEKSNYYLNLEYTKQDGVIKNTGYDRKSMRFNFETALAPGFKVGLNTTLSYNLQTDNNDQGYAKTLMISPLNPIKLANGGYIHNYTWGLSESGHDMVKNPLRAIELNISRNKAYRGLSKLFGELKLAKHVTLSSAVGVDFMLNERKEKIHPSFVLSGESEPGNGSIYEQQFKNANIITTNIVRYDQMIGNGHSINLLAGQEAQILTTKATGIEVRGISQNPDQDQLQGQTIISAGGVEGKQTLLSYFGQANYSFRNKYFLTASVRTDGSSRFGENERFGTYWSTGVAWIISEESFMKNTSDVFDYLKLRGSFGPAGNSSAILNFLRYDPISLVNNSNSLAVFPNRDRNPGNPNIKWEETFNVDMGIELRMLRERISFTADYYNRKTKNLIADNIPLGLATGFTTFTTNVGNVNNTGIELSAFADIISSNAFRWNLTANWSRNKNKLVKSYFPLQVIATGVTNKVGEEYNSFYLPTWAGVNPATGRPQWIDSLTGKPTEDYYASKPDIVGKAQPDGFGSITNMISFKNIELSAMVYYQYGLQIYRIDQLQNDGRFPYLNQSRSALNRWQKPGDISINPRRLLDGRTSNEVDEGYNESTRFLFDGDLIRLANVAIAYNFSKALLKKLHVQTLKVFAQGHNLATWTKYSGQDPESTNSSGGGYLLYPQQKSFSAGLNLTF